MRLEDKCATEGCYHRSGRVYRFCDCCMNDKCVSFTPSEVAEYKLLVKVKLARAVIDSAMQEVYDV